MVQKTGSIQIPDTFPVILKNYAKDMIRTQPFDILCWSASYFRCIASGIEPPTKSRFEEQLNAESHSLTKEFIKTLIKQVNLSISVKCVIILMLFMFAAWTRLLSRS